MTDVCQTNLRVKITSNVSLVTRDRECALDKHIAICIIISMNIIIVTINWLFKITCGQVTRN